MKGTTVTREFEDQHSICCPPIMELIHGIMLAKPSDVIAVQATDKESKETIPLWIAKAGEELVRTEQMGNTTRFVVRRVR
jgi:TusA-related sulfurtransferase